MTRLLAVLLLLLGATGCGGANDSEVPGLADRLDQVDAAAVADDDRALRVAIRELVKTAEAAEAAGDLSAAEADRITEAAAAVLAAAEDPEPEPTDDPPTSPSGEPGGSDGDDDGDDEDEDDEDD